MTEGFSNPLVGGIGTIIREYIKSPNYNPGASGWSINKDGSAEFNDATFRGTVLIDTPSDALLVYSTNPPAFGTLVFAVSSVLGSDSYGNVYDAGTNFYSSKGLSFWDSATAAATAVINCPAVGGQLHIHSLVNTTGIWLDPGGNPGCSVSIVNGPLLLGVLDTTRDGIKVGAGPRACCYSVNATYNQTCADNATTTIAGIIKTKEHSDFGNVPPGFPWSGGTFTAPMDGYYSATLLADNVVNAAGHSLVRIRVNGVDAARVQMIDITGGAGNNSLSVSLVKKWMVAGDTMTFAVLQHTGGILNVTGTISLGLEL